ncbi:magnesium transporter [Paenibacillus nanensis]|uniref:Magnesium transporter n=1 Tax=Paenibacillus nanensis TaxID=393251 RepID=A0A3A1URK2_9BACL|nr:magnesium transporter CorA family protein [Paenibacillus nanensis]RIX50874.1 magnesium transporter [Paenibacillus nanensis]
MIHRMLRYPAGWEWHVVQQARPQLLEQKSLPSRKSAAKSEQSGDFSTKKRLQALSEEQERLESEILDLKRQFPECAGWVDDCRDRRTNHISVDNLPGIGSLLCGTLMVQVTEDQTDIQPLHFWMMGKRLITMHEDMRLPLRLQSGTHSAKYEECELAPEAFFIMLGVLLETFHAGLDGFEQRLGELERAMRERNRTGLLDVIFDRRYDLLHWNHLFIPIRELYGAAKESFPAELAEKDAFIRITHKLDRIDTLLKHYAMEIDTLISMDDAISSFRGNDIMKTLTIFTVLFLPATVAGTLMGSNFEWLPFADLPWAFPAMITGVAVITVCIYLWLWRKGWTGDLLNKQGADALTTDPSEPIAGRSGRSGKHRKKLVNKHTEASLQTDRPLTRSRKNRMS